MNWWIVFGAFVALVVLSYLYCGIMNARNERKEFDEVLDRLLDHVAEAYGVKNGNF